MTRKLSMLLESAKFKATPDTVKLERSKEATLPFTISLNVTNYLHNHFHRNVPFPRHHPLFPYYGGENSQEDRKQLNNI